MSQWHFRGNGQELTACLAAWAAWTYAMHLWSSEYAVDEAYRWLQGVRDHNIADVTAVHFEKFTKLCG